MYNIADEIRDIAINYNKANKYMSDNRFYEAVLSSFSRRHELDIPFEYFKDYQSLEELISDLKIYFH